MQKMLLAFAFQVCSCYHINSGYSVLPSFISLFIASCEKADASLLLQVNILYYQSPKFNSSIDYKAYYVLFLYAQNKTKNPKVSE